MSARSNPGDAEEFADLLKNRYHGVHHYRGALCILYAKAENYQLSLDRWKVSTIRTYKDRGTVAKHEYLVATLCDAGGQELNLRMERRFQPSSTMSPITAFGSASSRSDVTASAGTQEKEEKFRKWAVDEISICPSNTLGNDQVQVDHLRFQDGHHTSLPRLAQLVVLACAISDYCATYHIMLSNCYWFCYVASEVLKKRFQVDNTLEPVGASSQLGRWNGIPVCSSGGIEEVLESYDKSWDDFCNKIYKIVNNPNNESTRKALQEVDRQKTRADLERARADEEKERRENAERELERLKAYMLSERRFPIEQGT